MSSASLPGVRSLFSDVDHYVDCRRTFLLRVKWVSDRMPRWCASVFPSLVDAMVTSKTGSVAALSSREHSSPFRVLSVGTGAGEINGMMIGHLKEKFPRIRCTVVEPCVNEIRKYQNYVIENKDEFKDIQFEWFGDTFEAFVRSGIEDINGKIKQFNFIEAVEAVYYLSNHEDALEEMYDSLAPGGLLLIIVAANNGGYHNLWKQHGDILGDDRMNFITSADVKDAFKKKGIPFSAVPEPNGSRVDISEVFDENSDVGNRILDFLTHICHFRKSVPQHIQDDLMSLLKSKKCSEIIDGRVLFNNSFEAIIVHRVLSH
ncbi:histamine N-methyltransferase-like [Ptychodera flava]|uniref:histamine N-methyltransferase-like n=1 Tax=Ptychodera flava TaxID=63121 RepID=UPI00396A8F67